MQTIAVAKRSNGLMSSPFIHVFMSSDKTGSLSACYIILRRYRPYDRHISRQSSLTVNKNHISALIVIGKTPEGQIRKEGDMYN
jgi:hypothetical protein